jgi:LacI family transcriptional regulator
MPSATTQDVAKLAHVSQATVSRVLNNRHDVAPQTVELVEEAIRRLGYKRLATRRGRPTATANPPALSRTPRRKAVTGIALLTPTQIGAMQSPLTAQLVDGVESLASSQGLHFHLARLPNDGSLPACLDPVQVDGIIVRSVQEPIRATLPQIPTVWIFKLGYGPTPGDLVLPDNEMIGEMAARYLLQCGHKHLAVVTAHLHHAEAQIRADRFERFARAAGATVFVLECKPDMEAITDQLLSQKPRVTGLFMPLGDNLVEGVYRALQRRGVSCGGESKDMNLISCNNDATHLRLLDPSLPNIDIRADEIGQEAAETLLWRIQHPHARRRSVVVEPRLVEPALTNEINEIPSEE